MKYGYLRAYKLCELSEFEEQVKADALYYDLTDELGNASINDDFNKVITSVAVNDTIVIKSLENAIRGVIEKEKEATGINDLLDLIRVVREKHVHLISLEDKNLNELISNISYGTVESFTQIIANKISKALSAKTKLGRPVKTYPKNFKEVYFAYKVGKEEKKMPNRVDSRAAAKQLGIAIQKFYSLVRDFES
jgi:hypothetical protein